MPGPTPDKSVIDSVARGQRVSNNDTIVVDSRGSARTAPQGSDILHTAGCRPNKGMYLPRGRYRPATDLAGIVDAGSEATCASQRSDVLHTTVRGPQKGAEVADGCNKVADNFPGGIDCRRIAAAA